MKIDLGCGYNKSPGYIGIDRFETPDTKIVCDFDVHIPLEDNSVDYVMASHSLEHAKDIMVTMEEIYRVCKHKAIVCIAAPYYSTSLNVANPYHKQVFNEHTARFFTNDPYSVIPQEEYYFPHAIAWGLGSSDNSNLNIDLRCVKLEYFYFPEYRKMDEKEKARLRNTSMNVVDQILIHLVVVKEEISREELLEISKMPLEEPMHVTFRRMKEQHEDSLYEKEQLENELNILQTTIEEIKKENKSLSQIVGELEGLARKEEKVENLVQTLEQQANNLKNLFSENSVLNDLFKKNIERLENIDTLKAEVAFTDSHVEENEMDPNQDQKNYELWIQHELSGNSKWKKLSNRIKRITNHKFEDLSNLINDLCKETVNYSAIQSNKSLDNYVLTLSDPIKHEGIIYYEVSPKHDNWNGIECIFTNYRSESRKDYLAFEVLSMDHQIIRTVLLNSTLIKHNEPTTLRFDEIQHSGGNNYIVRFMGISPYIWGIQLYEWVEFNRVGKKVKTAFAGRLL